LKAILPDRATAVRSLVAVAAVTVVGLLFIASYAGALHDPRPHDVPVAVAGPPRLVAALQGSGALKVLHEPDAAAAYRAIDRRDAYGAVVAGEASIEVRVAPAASLAVAMLLRAELPRRLRSAGPVHVTVVHPLPSADTRGVVPFYVAVGWVVAGYLATSLLGIAFGTRPGRARLAWRLASCVLLGILMGIGGALLGHAIGDLGSWLGLAAIGALAVFAVAAVTLALQAVFGILGTGVAILIFVVLGNPSSGGPFATELLPGLWRTVGPYIPTGAAVTAIHNVAYFPDASLWPALAVLLIWAAAGVVGTLAFGRRPHGDPEMQAAMASAAAPWMEWLERRRAALMLGEPIRGVYNPPAAGRIVDRLKALFSDPSSCAAGRARHSYDAALGCRPIECCASRSATQVAVLAGAVERSASPSAPRQTVSVEPGPTQTWVCATTRVSRSAARPSMSKNRRGESPGGFDDRQSGVSSQPTPLSVGVGL
jgi:hypothetical protein